MEGIHGRRFANAACATIFASVFMVAAPALAKTEGVFDPATPQARSIRDLFLLVIAITAAIFVVVQGLLIYCVVKFRRREPPPGEPETEPAQIYGSRPVEVAWTVAPLLVVFVLFLVVFRTMAELREQEPPEGAFRVRVVGRQWWWEYQYPDLGFTTANELHVPAGTEAEPKPILLELESADVIHSFWVPRLGGKTDVVPGRTNKLWFSTMYHGRFDGNCAEYCGAQHGNMLIKVVVDPDWKFQQWADEQKKPANVDPKADEARRLFLSLACVNCHTVRGTPAKGTAGPDLTHLMSRATLASGQVPNDHETRLRWVKDPQSIKPGCLMPAMHLTDGEVAKVVLYLETLK